MGFLSNEKVIELELKANAIRESIIEMLIAAGSGHTAGPLGTADIFTLLFFHVMRHDPTKPDWAERDHFVLSNGHICPVYYATLGHAGYFPVEELLTLRKFGSRLQGHPHREFLSMLETSSGPLGSGLSQAVGMAIADRIDHGRTHDRYIYCMTSDGEHNAGNTWEGIMLAGKERLRNLIVFVDRNNIQIDGYTEDIMPLDSLADKYESFNWHVQEVDGHNFEALMDAVGKAKAVFEKPSVIIARTIPGKGVHEFERDFKWHGYAPNSKTAAEDYKKALYELRTLGGRIKSEHQ